MARVFYFEVPMQLTDKHVSDDILKAMINCYDKIVPEKGGEFYHKCVLDVLLELKQRRAEDRQREADKCATPS